VIEDSPTGVRAGVAAGCRVIGVGPLVADVVAPGYRHVGSLTAVTLADLG
jgi:beta-phosphoglucomutase-like phosphatase (HAD superfamily)